MTMIACIINKVAPVIIGDLLISQTEKPTTFQIPVLDEDVLQYLSNKACLYPVSLDQKIYILKSNVCIAFSGTVYYFKNFLEDISIFCRANETITSRQMDSFLKNYKHDGEWQNFSFVLLVIERENESFNVGRFLHGDWQKQGNDTWGDVFTSGSGATDFLIEASESIKILSQLNPNSMSYVMQINIIMICKLLTKERLNLGTLKNNWGAGFELVYYDKNEFKKLDDITYVINFGEFDDVGNIPEVPVPAVIMNYKYHKEMLVITVIQTSKGTTQITDKKYIISSKDFSITRYLITPINFSVIDESDKLSDDASFTSFKNAMGYIIKTSDGHYLPTSFNIGPELEVVYKHPEEITITMVKEFNDTLVNEAKLAFPKL